MVKQCSGVTCMTMVVKNIKTSPSKLLSQVVGKGAQKACFFLPREVQNLSSYFPQEAKGLREHENGCQAELHQEEKGRGEGQERNKEY